MCSVPRAAPVGDRGYWGPAAWKLLHGTALHEPRRLTPRWFRLLAEVLPCAECCAHLRSNLEALPPPDAPSALFAWSVALHNRVNSQLGKPGVSAAEARRLHSRVTPADVRPFYHSVAVLTPVPCTARRRDDTRAFFAALGIPVSDASLRSRRSLVRALLGAPCVDALATPQPEQEACNASCSLPAPSAASLRLAPVAGRGRSRR